MSDTYRRPVYTVVQLAAFLGWSEDTIRREIRDGHLKARKRRADTVIVEADLLAYLDSLPVHPDYADAAASGPSRPTPITVPAHAAPKASGGRVVRRFSVVASEATS